MRIDQGLRPRELPEAAVTGVAELFPDLPEAVAARNDRASHPLRLRRDYAAVGDGPRNLRAALMTTDIVTATR